MSSYQPDEVAALVEGFIELTELKSRRLWILVRLADLSTAIGQLPPEEKEALLLVGICGYDRRTAGQILGTTRMTVHRRYVYAYNKVIRAMNEGNMYGKDHRLGHDPGTQA